MADPKATERLQIILGVDELSALDDWRFAHRMPSRAAAVRELLRRGLGFGTDGAEQTGRKRKSRDYRVVAPQPGANGNGSHRH
jgi:hypothetical protein